MKSYKLYVLLLILIPFTGSPQVILDGYWLSAPQISGTARSGSMGNAFGALGGDFTSLSINPAGIGIYQNSELVITPSFNTNESETFLDGTYSDNRYKLNFENLGYVGTIRQASGSESNVTAVNFGVGFNNILDLNQNFYANYGSSPNSYLDGIVNWANSENLSNDYLSRNIGDVEYRDWPTKLAWDTYLIDPYDDGQGNVYDGQYVNILYENERVNQQKNYTYKGGIKEFQFTGGVNFNHQLYLGASIGIRDVSITQRSDYSEILEDNNSFTFYENYKLYGTGYNAKIGIIFKPVNAVRLGLAFHSPTFYELTDKAYLAMDAQLADYYESEGTNFYDYNLTTPMKAVFSTAFVLGRKAILSFDGEYLDYTMMRFRDKDGGRSTFNDLNTQIDDLFQNVFNIRLGAEYRLDEQVSLRGGYENYANPFNNNIAHSGTTQVENTSIVSIGIGYTNNYFYTDLAYRTTIDEFNLYSPQPNYDNVGLTSTNNKILLTLGFKF